MATDVSEVCDNLWHLRDPADHAALSTAAANAARFRSDAALVADVVENIMTGAAGGAADDDDGEAARHDVTLTMWMLIDKLCKEAEVFVDVFRDRLITLAERFGFPPSAPQHALFKQLFDGWKFVFGPLLVSLIDIKLKERFRGGGGAEGLVADAPALAITTDVAQAAAQRSKGALIQHNLRSVGGFSMQNANNARPDGMAGALLVKTRDSLQTMRVSSMYAPSMPVEMTIAMPERDADAPVGHMQALPAGHDQDYLEQRKSRLRAMADKWKQKEDEAGERKRQRDADRAATKGAAGAGGEEEEDPFEGVKMPEQLPRDEFGVLIGNFPAGIRFLRDAIAAAGGALELLLIEERIAELADREVQREFGNVRQFLNIHRPTFTVHNEADRWVVRLADDPPPDPAKPFSWDHTECPYCSYILKGRNVCKHMNNRKCIGIQISNGLMNRLTSPIAKLSFAAKYIMERIDDIDDDDVMWFAECIELAGEEKRFRYGSSRQFAPVLKAIREVRDKWLDGKDAATMAAAPISADDRCYARFFGAVGRNLRRLPIAWIDTGDVVDMGRRFCSGIKPPWTQLPRAGDPRIRMTNVYAGMLFAESDTDKDDEHSSDEEEFSDDEAAQFEFAPPVSPMETVMVAGMERDTKKLNYRLRTAPPIPAGMAIKAEGKQGMADVYKSVPNAGVSTQRR
jgi:hypothetical protein